MILPSLSIRILSCWILLCLTWTLCFAILTHRSRGRKAGTPIPPGESESSPFGDMEALKDTMKDQRIEIPPLQGHSCFACGTENPIGLKLRFYRLNESVCTDITLGKYHEGWQNMAHGGIISTLLDEVMSWTIIYFKQIFFVTRRMDIKYIRPVLLGIPLTVKGRLLKEKKEPYIGAVSEIFDQEAQILARATGEFVELPQEKMLLVPERLKEDMVSLFNRFEEATKRS